MNNAYADKYSETSDLAGSVASISINSCENAMKVVFQAKEALKKGDKEGWISNLEKVHAELSGLIKALNKAPGGDYNEHMSLLYFNLGLKNSDIMQEFDDPNKADFMIEKFQEVRNFWRDLIKEVLAHSDPKEGS